MDRKIVSEAVPRVGTIPGTSDSLIQACYHTDAAKEAMWRSGSAMSTTLPIFLLQLIVVLSVNRALLLLLRPLRQPRIVAHIVCGVLLGPTCLGKTETMREYVTPFRTTMLVETFANLALVYYMFLEGLQTDFGLISRCGIKAITVTSAGILIPFAVGYSLFLTFLGNPMYFDTKGALFWGVSLTSTNFSDLARILADLKLLRSDVGQIAMPSAILSDLSSWFLLVLVLSVFNGSSKYYTMTSTYLFIFLAVFLGRPALSRTLERSTKGETPTEQHIWFIMAGVILFGFITDCCGAHSITGAFLFGAIMPRTDVIRSAVVERLDDFITGILMPLFFLTSGFRTELPIVTPGLGIAKASIIVILSSAAKVVSTFMVSTLYRLPPRDGLALGLLMNTKGVLALIIINTGRNITVLNDASFSLMVVALLVMSCIIEPSLIGIYKPTRPHPGYENRTLQHTPLNAELGLLACVHSPRNLAGMLGVLELSSATDEAPLSVYAIHLVELTERASTAMLIVHDEESPAGLHTTKTDTTQIIHVFKEFDLTHRSVTVQTITAVSPYATMHLDICSLAEDKRAAMIILPFHMQLSNDGQMKNANTTFAQINEHVMATAPCSVGILVYRGLSSYQQVGHHNQVITRQVATIFIGGPDDREAVSYARRLSLTPGVKLTVLRFLPGDKANAAGTVPVNTKENQLDEAYIQELKFNLMDESGTISYSEKAVNGGEETMAAIKGMGDVYNMYVVGRGKGVESVATSGLSDWATCPELGIIGDALSCSSFAYGASVLVVQQYVARDDDTNKEPNR